MSPADNTDRDRVSGFDPGSANCHGNELNRELPVFRFSLRQVLAFFAVVSVFLAVLTASGGASSLSILLLAAIVAAHVFATALGARLRAGGSRE